MAVVEFKNISFGYQKDNLIFQNLSFSVQAGESIFLKGPSGSGKTTLLDLISGLSQPQKGQVFLFGKDVTNLSTSARDQLRGQEIGVIYQTLHLLPYLSVIDNITLPSKIFFNKRFADLNDLNSKAMSLLSQVGLSDIAQKKVTELSVGQQQRVAICRALVGSPKLVLADEPTSALDQENTNQFVELLLGLCQSQSSALIYVSHDPRFEERFLKSWTIQELTT